MSSRYFGERVSSVDGRLESRESRMLLSSCATERFGWWTGGAVNTLWCPDDSVTLLRSMALANHVRSVVGNHLFLMSSSDTLMLNNLSVTLITCHNISAPIVHLKLVVLVKFMCARWIALIMVLMANGSGQDSVKRNTSMIT